MNTKTLEYILVIAQEESLSGAAEKLYMSQPVLSRHLKKIEEELGADLFIRKHDGMELTDAGRIFVNNARAILHVEEELENDLKKFK